MRDGNPYTILGIPDTAGELEIEDAYNALFDRYEPQAQNGDDQAAQMLEELNRAHDMLLDPELRDTLDLSLAAPATPAPQPTGSATTVATTTTTTTTGGTGRSASGTRSRQSAVARASGSAQRTTQQTTQRTTGGGSRSRGSGSSNLNRPRSVAPRPQQSSTMPMAFVFGGVLLLLLVVAVVVLVTRNNNGGATNNGSGGQSSPVTGVLRTDSGSVVATVNGQPIYDREYQDRAGKDRANAASDALMGSLLAAGGITATRMIDVINQDALDKLINMEVIQQQARKENLYPSDQEKTSVIEQAKQTDLKGQTFQDFLAAHKITEEQYNNSVVQNVVYAVMASKHMPPTGNDDERTNGFLSWICQTRQGYDVKINLTFTVENKPCTSGLPSDVPITGMPSQSNQTTVPDDVPTVAPALTPKP